MAQKILFITRVLATPRGQFSALCRQFGIARKTGCKWLARHRAAQSLTALQERSRRPQQSPRRISPGFGGADFGPAFAGWLGCPQARLPAMGTGRARVGGHGASDPVTSSRRAPARSAYAGLDPL